MNDLAHLLEPYGVPDLATVHRMIAQARENPLLVPLRAERASTAGRPHPEPGPA